MNRTIKSSKTLARWGAMDTNLIYVHAKLKRIELWAEKSDPNMHEKILSIQSKLNDSKSIANRMLADFREFDLDRIPEIARTVEDLQKICEEALNLEAPSRMLLDEAKAQLKERRSQLKNGEWPEDDPISQRLQAYISKLERT